MALKFCCTCKGTFYNDMCDKCFNKDMYEPKDVSTYHYYFGSVNDNITNITNTINTITEKTKGRSDKRE